MFGIFASILDGVLVGAVYGLAAMGLTLIWGVMNVINLTHGAMIVAGMFGLYYLASVAGAPTYAAIPPIGIAGFLFGGLVGAALLLLRIARGKSRIPFGPSMLAGTFLAVFAAAPIADWYLALLVPTP